MFGAIIMVPIRVGQQLFFSGYIPCTPYSTSHSSQAIGHAINFTFLIANLKCIPTLQCPPLLNSILAHQVAPIGYLQFLCFNLCG